MSSFSRTKVAVIILFLVLAVMGIGTAVFYGLSRTPAKPTPPIETPGKDGAVHERIGTSVEGRALDAYTFLPAQAGGAESKHLLFVGGMHGGYEWNSVLIAYQFIDFLEATVGTIPSGLSVTVIPSINPDGVYKVTGKVGRFNLTDVSRDEDTLAQGRFNAHEVDLNRNFDCKWKPEGTWKSKTVSAGSAPFSEPEAKALKDFVAKNTPDAVIFWHSKASAVYASECENGILPETLALMSAYAKASGYRAVKAFDAYEVTGDAEGWLASIGIPAITVELSTHETIEWERNLAGIRALFEYYGEKNQLKR